MSSWSSISYERVGKGDLHNDLQQWIECCPDCLAGSWEPVISGTLVTEHGNVEDAVVIQKQISALSNDTGRPMTLHISRHWTYIVFETWFMRHSPAIEAIQLVKVSLIAGHCLRKHSHSFITALQLSCVALSSRPCCSW